MPRRGLLLELMLDPPEYVLVDRSPFVIGRDRGCDLPLVSARVAPMHAEIARRGSGWTVRAIVSHGATTIDGRRVVEASELAVGARIQIGELTLRVVALDHEAGDGELTGAITRTARLASPGVTCTLDLRITSATGSAHAELALDALLRGLDAADPVGAIAAYRAFAERSREPIGAVHFRVTLVRLELDANAIALLAEPAPPAQAMWDWLWLDDRDALLAPAANIVGIVRTHPPDDVPPPALVAAAPPAPLLVWIRRGPVGQLARIDRAQRLAWPADPHRTPHALDFAPMHGRWYVVIDNVGRELVPGTPVTLNYTTVLAV